jgi:hypothetical protein
MIRKLESVEIPPREKSGRLSIWDERRLGERIALGEPIEPLRVNALKDTSKVEGEWHTGSRRARIHYQEISPPNEWIDQGFYGEIDLRRAFGHFNIETSNYISGVGTERYFGSSAW